MFLLNIGIQASFYESEYNQYFEDAVFGNEELLAFEPDIVYIHTSFCNLLHLPNIHMTDEEVNQLLQEEFNRYQTIWNSLKTKFPNCVIIQNNFEYPPYRLLGNADCCTNGGYIHFVDELNCMFYQQKSTNFYIQDIHYLSSCYGLDHWYSPKEYYLYKNSLSNEAVPYLCLNLANIIKSFCGLNKKAIVLDLDNTLWGGIIGDDGVENIEMGTTSSIGQAYTDFQKYIKNISQLGIPLLISSKNEEENALAGLKRSDCILKPDDFLLIKANWEPKTDNITIMANQIGLTPDAFVFVDDNIREQALVKETIPKIAVPSVEDVLDYIRILDRNSYFEVTNFSKEDLKRTEMYQDNVKRNMEIENFTDYDSYLKSLDMKATILPIDNISSLRCSQLSNKSNQFNLTTRRYSQNEILEVSGSKNYITLSGSLIDKYGDNGIVSVVIGKIRDNQKDIDIELWIMSCRVLKRNMELAMMNEWIHVCQKRHIENIYGYYYPTEKNKMVVNFYEQFGFEKISMDDVGNTIWHLNTNQYVFQDSFMEVNPDGKRG